MPHSQASALLFKGCQREGVLVVVEGADADDPVMRCAPALEMARSAKAKRRSSSSNRAP